MREWGVGPKIFDGLQAPPKVHTCTCTLYMYALPLCLTLRLGMQNVVLFYFFTHNCRLLDRILRVNVTLMVTLCVEYADATMNGEFSNHTSLVTAKD